MHTGDVQLRDEGNYIGPTINRTARLRGLAHGGQTALLGTTEALVVDTLPAEAWLTDLGTYELRGVPRPERVVQLCHPDLRNEFPPLRTADSVVAHNLPVQLTSFVGRQAEMNIVRGALAGNRRVTLTGAGGVGKTCLAVQVANQVAGDYGEGVRYVDLAPITHPGPAVRKFIERVRAQPRHWTPIVVDGGSGSCHGEEASLSSRRCSMDQTRHEISAAQECPDCHALAANLEAHKQWHSRLVHDIATAVDTDVRRRAGAP